MRQWELDCGMAIVTMRLVSVVKLFDQLLQHVDNLFAKSVAWEVRSLVSLVAGLSTPYRQKIIMPYAPSMLDRPGQSASKKLHVMQARRPRIVLHASFTLTRRTLNATLAVHDAEETTRN